MYYQHTDAGGIVYHANYLSFMEAARTELLRSVGFDLAELASEQRVLFIVHRLNVAYLRPARLNDLLETTAEVERIGLARIIFRQRVWSNENLLVDGQSELACVDPATFRPVAVPETIKERLQPLVANGPVAKT